MFFFDLMIWDFIEILRIVDFCLNFWLFGIVCHDADGS